MAETIAVVFDAGLGAYLVTMPEGVTLPLIRDLGPRIHRAFRRVANPPRALLIDTNLHGFESIACLRSLRDILEASWVAAHCRAVAFVQPHRYRPQEIVSPREGYFTTVEAARDWLLSLPSAR